MFTDEEKRYLKNTESGNYRLSYKEDTPNKIAVSIRNKINAHKKWLEEVTGNGLQA
jgi:hypothetical protein